MDLNLHDKVVLITGGAGTIGSAAAEVFLHEGSYVIVADSNLDKGAEVAARLNVLIPGRCRFLDFDLGDEGTIDTLVEEVLRQYGKIDCIVNNAATFFFEPLESWISSQALDLHYQVGLRGHTLLIQKIWQQCPQSKSGSIVNVSSVAGHIGEPNAFAYTPIKAALKGLTLSCAIDMASAGGWAVTISPGHTWSVPHQERAAAERLTRKEYEDSKSSIQSTMFGKFLEPWEVAQWIALLASPVGKALTGQDVHVTSGIEAGGFNRSYRTNVNGNAS